MIRILVAICLWMGVGRAQDSRDLVGRWRSAETSKGGIGAMYDFFQDGTAQFSPGAIVPMRYRVEGDNLITYPVDGPSFTLSWKDDDHLRMSVKGAGEDYTRLGAKRDPNYKLLGEWTGNRNMDGNVVAVHWIFKADYSALLTIRFLTLKGQYALRGGSLSATFGAQRALNGSVILGDEFLTIQRNGKTIQLKRY